MKTKYSFLLLFAAILGFSQSGKWSDLFSYNNVLALKESNGRIVAATENGLFFYTPERGEITKLSKANGLHEVKISAFDYNPATQTGLIGYVSGHLEVISGNKSYYIVDIPLSQGFSGNKRINHIFISGDLAVISADYGVSLFNLKTREFGDTAFFNRNGNFLAVREAVIQDNKVYAATAEGMKYHEINVSFPVYNEWGTDGGAATQISGVKNLVVGNQTQVKFGMVNNWKFLSQSFEDIRDIEADEQTITVTDQTRSYVFNQQGILQNSFDAGEQLNTSRFLLNKFYFGTRRSGMLNDNKISLKPDGPYSNTAYKLTLLDDKILVSTGSRESRYNTPPSPVLDLGFYFFNGSEWIYPSYFVNNPIAFNALDAVFNPGNPKEIYFNNYIFNSSQGIYRMQYDEARKDFDLVKFYSSTRTDVYHNRPVGFEFDDKNNLFGTHAFHDGPGQAGYFYFNKTKDDFTFYSIKIGQAAEKPKFYEGLLWMPLSRGGELVALDFKNPESESDDVIYRVGRNQGIPSNAGSVLSIAFDKTGDAWIGTDNGLRVLAAASTAVLNNPKASPVVIEQDGIAEELFKDLAVLQIAVDAGNQKWVSIDGGGVFYLNPTGEKTLLNFNKQNSPLPSNTITDIQVDTKSGKVYFASFDGIVVYQGDVGEINSAFGEVLVYPNPVVLSRHKNGVTIKGLAEKTHLRITDSAGNLVHQSISRGGFYIWDLKNSRGNFVSTGIYMVLLSNGDGTDKATAKIAVIR